MLRAASIVLLSFLLSGCILEKTANPQASESACEFLWSTFKDNMQTAQYSEGTDKIYYAEIAHMNLTTLLLRGCCKYDDTCPAAIKE